MQACLHLKMNITFRGKEKKKTSQNLPERFFPAAVAAAPWYRRISGEPDFSRRFAERTEHHQPAELCSRPGAQAPRGVGQEKAAGMAALGDISTAGVVAGSPWQSWERVGAG